MPPIPALNQAFPNVIAPYELLEPAARRAALRGRVAAVRRDALARPAAVRAPARDRPWPRASRPDRLREAGPHRPPESRDLHARAFGGRAGAPPEAAFRSARRLARRDGDGLVRTGRRG